MCDYNSEACTNSLGSEAELKPPALMFYCPASPEQLMDWLAQPLPQQEQQQQDVKDGEHSEELEQQQQQVPKASSSSASRKGRPRARKSQESLVAQSQVCHCCVCGDPATGFHYSALTCEACKSFFKRTVQDKHKYTCIGNFDCAVSKSQRKVCQYCRFQKCLRSGMLPQEVRMDHTRGGRRKSKRLASRQQFDELVGKISCCPAEPTATGGASACATKPPSASSSSSLPVSLASSGGGDGGLDRLLRNFVRNVEAAHASCCRAPVELPLPAWLAADVKTPAAFRLAVRHWFRLGLGAVVRWSSSLACLAALPREDLRELLHENWLAVLALDTLAWSQPFDGTIRFGSNFSLRQADVEEYMPLADFYCTLQSMFWSLDALQLQPSELAVLKLVVLLDQSVADRLVDAEALGPLSGAAMRALYAVCAEKLGADAASGLVDDYIGKLVMLLGFTVNLRHGCRVWTSLDPPSCSEARELIDAALPGGQQHQQQHEQQSLRRQEGSSGSFCLSSSSSAASLLL